MDQRRLSWVLPLGLLAFALSAQAYPAVRQEQALLDGKFDVVSSDLSKVISKSPMLSFHRQLIEIESISTNENSVGNYIIEYLQEHGFLVAKQAVSQSDPTKKDRFNVLALTPGTIPGTHIDTIVTSHIDTVPPFIPYNLSYPSTDDSASTFTRDDIVISGRGSVDAKGCVAAQVHAVLDLLDSESIKPNEVALLFVVGEEQSGDGMRTFSESPHNSGKYNAVIFGEPTELKLATGHKGILMTTITAKGKAAHSGYPWLGRSANSMIIPALAIMDQLGSIPEEDGGLPSSEKYGNTTVNLGLLEGGVAANVVPEEATVKVALRLAGGTREKAIEIIKKALADLGEHYEITFSQGYGPIDIDADVSGFETVTVNYGTDIPNLEVNGSVKRYLYGPGTITVAHSDHEALTIGDMEDALEGYKQLILHSLK
ncbi:putative acetylornithine deacetylase [Phaeomoniella chlamydospora]|uniref:Putative acetylornithine deacetylase n=1 Tax=Phaeomoniella chlamydospora TaxID=158046 RepID=A0A0G2GDA7_PHACM|nr:putative acetylornithine deacetylase [Phaeomoniella chlamydospora]